MFNILEVDEYSAGISTDSPEDVLRLVEPSVASGIILSTRTPLLYTGVNW